MYLRITTKLLSGLIIIFTLGVVITIYLGSHIIEKNNENIITKELSDIKKISTVYIRQKFLFYHPEDDETYLRKISLGLVEELQKLINSDVSIYTKSGEGILVSDYKRLAETYEDIKYAKDKKTAYTIITNKEKVLVYYSFPIFHDQEQIGIIRIQKDYSYLYHYNKRVMDSILNITLLVFLTSLIFVFLFTRSFIRPIIHLSHISQKVSKGDFSIKEPVSRNDEIGILHKNFNNMMVQIEEQIETIRADRDKLMEVNHYRKQFYDRVTHELKTPLTTILGYSSLLKNREYDREFFDKSIDYIREESERLHKMVVDLLEYSKHGNILEDEFEVINMSALIQNTSEEMRIKAKRYGMEIGINVRDDYFVNGVREKLKEVFINIIDNGIKYGIHNTAIHINSETIDETLYLSIKNKSNHVPKETLEKLLMPYHKNVSQATGERGSIGLGLSICKEIIEKHGGSITIKSSIEEDFILTIVIPLVKEEKEIKEEIKEVVEISKVH